MIYIRDYIMKNEELVGRQRAIIEKNRDNRKRNADKLEEWALKHAKNDTEILNIVTNLRETLY